MEKESFVYPADAFISETVKSTALSIGVINALRKVIAMSELWTSLKQALHDKRFNLKREAEARGLQRRFGRQNRRNHVSYAYG